MLPPALAAPCWGSVPPAVSDNSSYFCIRSGIFASPDNTDHRRDCARPPPVSASSCWHYSIGFSKTGITASRKPQVADSFGVIKCGSDPPERPNADQNPCFMTTNSPAPAPGEWQTAQLISKLSARHRPSARPWAFTFALSAAAKNRLATLACDIGSKVFA